VCGCLGPGERVFEFGCASVWVRVCVCLSLGVRVFGSGCELESCAPEIPNLQGRSQM
jgi:hypothetical protein